MFIILYHYNTLFFLLFYVLSISIISIIGAIKRFHDFNWNGWSSLWIVLLIALFPPVGIIIIGIIIGFIPGTIGANRFGDDPLGDFCRDYENYVNMSYFSIKGRINRKKYWLQYILPMYIYFIISMIIINSVSYSNDQRVFFWLFYVLSISIISIISAIKRFHDFDWNGWSSLWVVLLPPVGIIIGFIPGTIGANRFGDDPLGNFCRDCENYVNKGAIRCANCGSDNISPASYIPRSCPACKEKVNFGATKCHRCLTELNKISLEK
jgi:uncharacterized membrane protein YhaH (DUF805 family)